MSKMVRVLVTGSSDGIGLAAAKLLADQGHQVTLHARNTDRAKQAREAVPKATNVVIGDMSTIDGAKKLAAEAKKAGPYDTVVHNAGVGGFGSEIQKNADGLQSTFAINSLSPYILTSLMDKPKRLLYLSSSLHYSSDGNLTDIAGQSKLPSASQAYSDSKLQNSLFANAVARLWPDVQSCSLDPGWIKTKMGGSSAPGSTDSPGKAIADYAIGKSPVGSDSGKYFTPAGVKEPNAAVEDISKQDQYLKTCAELSGVAFPA